MTEQTHWSGRNLQTPGALPHAAGAGVGPDAGVTGEATPGPNGAGGEAEQVRLDAAMRRADELLVDSLRRDDSRRLRRRRLGVLAILISGALIMTAIICVLLAALAGQAKNGTAAAAGGKPDAAQAERAEKLSAEGWQLWQQRKMSDAEAKFAEAVKLDATHANAWNGLGWSRFNQGKAKEAIEPFEKAVAIQADHPAALNGLGQVYLAEGKLEQAEKFLTKAAAHDAGAAWFGLARLYLVKGDYDRALPWALLVSKEPGAEPMAAEMLTAARERKVDGKLKKQIEPAKKS